MEGQNELGSVLICDGLTYIRMHGENQNDPVIGEIVVDLTAVDEGQFKELINAVSVFRNFWDKYYAIAKERSDLMRRKSNHMDNMAKMRADGGPMALRMKEYDLRIQQLEEKVKSLEDQISRLKPAG